MLGDGHIRYNPIKTPNVNGRLEFTFSAKALYYAKYLKFYVLVWIYTKSRLSPWPNTVVTGKNPTQYWFCTKQLAEISQFYTVWYKEINGKYIKKLPLNIEELLTFVGLAHWIMEDGYFDYYTTVLYTDNFSKEEVLNLIGVLKKKFRT